MQTGKLRLEARLAQGLMRGQWMSWVLHQSSERTKPLHTEACMYFLSGAVQLSSVGSAQVRSA